MPNYASRTSVGTDASRTEIERTLRRYGATSFAYGWEGNVALLGFTVNGKQVRFVLPLPDPDDREFTHTPAKGAPRGAAQAEAAYQQAVRQRWRALALVIKAKLEAVEAGIVTFEQEFFPHVVLPNGKTVFESAAPAVELAYETGRVKPLLEIDPGEGAP